MRADKIVLAAAVVLGCAGWATAAPLIPSLPAATLEASRDVEVVRWRHRGRGWGYRGYQRFDRDFADDRAFAEAIRPGNPEAARFDRHRRGGWVDPPREF